MSAAGDERAGRAAPAPTLPPHAPEGGWARRLLGRFHVTGSFWYRFHGFGMSVLPDWGVFAVVHLFTAFFFVFLVRIGRAIGSNLEPVLGPCGFIERRRRVYRTMLTFAWCLSERYERLLTDKPFSIAIDLERWRRVARPGRGFIMVTAHLGNFEVGSMLPSFEESRRVIVVREPEVDPEAQRYIKQTLEQASGGRWVNFFQGDDPLSGIFLLETLREGGIVGVQGDRPHAGGRAVEASLFGMPFALPAGPAALARSAEVPLVPVFVLREGRRAYRIEIADPIEVLRTREREADVAAAMRRVAVEIERAIASAPHQWFCFRQLWKPGTATARR
jgi:KDO2-lipid IV(A) lauroyltransferase